MLNPMPKGIDPFAGDLVLDPRNCRSKEPTFASWDIVIMKSTLAVLYRCRQSQLLSKYQSWGRGVAVAWLYVLASILYQSLGSGFEGKTGSLAVILSLRALANWKKWLTMSFCEVFNGMMCPYSCRVSRGMVPPYSGSFSCKSKESKMIRSIGNFGDSCGSWAMRRVGVTRSFAVSFSRSLAGSSRRSIVAALLKGQGEGSQSSKKRALLKDSAQWAKALFTMKAFPLRLGKSKFSCCWITGVQNVGVLQCDGIVQWPLIVFLTKMTKLWSHGEKEQIGDIKNEQIIE